MHPRPIKTVSGYTDGRGKSVRVVQVADTRTPYRVEVTLSGGHVLPPSYHTTQEAAERTARGHR